LRFKEVLGVKIPIRPYSLIEVLLLLEFTLSLDVLLLQLSDDIVVKFYLLKALVVFSIGLGRFKTILLLVVLKLIDELL
jgi:hypothetical protein